MTPINTLSPVMRAIHQDSVTVGRQVASSWQAYKADPSSDTRLAFGDLLESYISLRQKLPRDGGSGNHVGFPTAHAATQGN